MTNTIEVRVDKNCTLYPNYSSIFTKRKTVLLNLNVAVWHPFWLNN